MEIRLGIVHEINTGRECCRLGSLSHWLEMDTLISNSRFHLECWQPYFDG